MYKRQKVTINGRERWLSFKSTQDLVDKVVAIYQTERAQDPLFKEYLMHWFETYKEPQLEKNTAGNYRSMIRNHILPCIGTKSISDISINDVQRILSSLKSASHAKQVKSILNLVMEAAIADELYHHPNPTRDKRISMPTARTKRPALTNDEVASLLTALPHLPFEQAQLLVMLIMTGSRRSEALAAQWEDIDWIQKTIHLQRVIRFRNNSPEVSEKMKTASANRIVALWEDFLPFLGEPQASGFIISRDGFPITERQYMTLWTKIQANLKGLGFPSRFTAHQLRHTYATIAANSGSIPLKVLQGMMGHANFQTTMNTYADFDREKIIESSRELSTKFAVSAPKIAEKLQHPKSENRL